MAKKLYALKVKTNQDLVFEQESTANALHEEKVVPENIAFMLSVAMIGRILYILCRNFSAFPETGMRTEPQNTKVVFILSLEGRQA